MKTCNAFLLFRWQSASLISQKLWKLFSNFFCSLLQKGLRYWTKDVLKVEEFLFTLRMSALWTIITFMQTSLGDNLHRLSLSNKEVKKSKKLINLYTKCLIIARKKFWASSFTTKKRKTHFDEHWLKEFVILTQKRYFHENLLIKFSNLWSRYFESRFLSKVLTKPYFVSRKSWHEKRTFFFWNVWLGGYS